MENEVRLIDANALHHELVVEMVKCVRMSEETKMTMAERVLNKLDEAPTIDPESLRPKGRWKFVDIDGWWFNECSICGDMTPNRDGSSPGWNYCSNCGAKMEG